MKTKKEQLKEFLEILFNCAEETAEVEQNNAVNNQNNHRNPKQETENESE